ncbi:hypothetical protein [Klebsiella quasipneumoniae]|uniref:hypothetical protein n=1 Tax=Klebsiella quasipneumoniae TaxID=1463165 RepID=UPI00399057D4
MALTLLATNNAESTLASAISATDTSLIVSAGTGAEFPDAVAGESYFKLTLTDAATGSQVEIVNVTAKAGDIFTIERAQEGTLARAWAANDMVANMMTADTLNVIAQYMQQAAASAGQAIEAANDASEYAKNKYTFYKTASDPDGTIAGLAATTDGQSFWVAQGPDALSAAWQYQNKAGVAVLQAKQPGTAAVTGTIREFPTLAAAQADADAGNIPIGSTAYYRSADDATLAIEVINTSGTLQPTGRKMPSAMPMGYQSATAVSSGAANTIAITIPGLLVDGSLIYFLSPILNTAAVSVTVTDSKGNSVTRSVLRRANAVLVGGELIQYNPVLMVYRGAPTDNFMLIASGATASEVAASLTAYKTTNDALTTTLKNQVPIPVTVSSVADDIYTATSSITSGELQNGRLFLFTPPSANTTRTPKLKLNAWGAYNITRIDGGQVAAGDLYSGRPHLLYWHAGANQFRVMTYADERAKIYGTVLRATMTSDASTPNDLSVTVDGYIDNGTLVVLEPPATNTGAVAITVVNRYGDQIVRSVFKGANAPLAGGEIKYAEPVLLMYRGAPQNNFKIITSGDLSTPVAKLQSDVETLKASFTDPYAKLAKKLIGDGTVGNTGPFGSISFTNGVRTTVKRRLVFTSIGSSVGVGAGSTGGGVAGAPFAPNTLFVEAMKAQLAGYGNFEFIDDNQCIPTQALQQFSAQLQNSPYFTSTNENDWPDFVLIIGGMNDAPVGNFNNGLTFPAQRGKLEALIDECKAKGAVVIVATSPHHNPLSPSVTAMNLGSINVSWPVRTFNVDTNYTFDAAARTINGGAFSYGTGNAATSWGGQILRVGHTLRILSGDNAGDYPIEAISEDRNTITVAESFPASGLMKTTIRHIGLDSLKEEILEPPPSESFVERDWSGSGTKTVGAARFGMVNSMFRSVARDKAVFLMECEIPWFRDGVEVHGWNALFDGTNYNHPNDLGYTVSYKAGADKAAFDLCNLIYGEKYYLPN